MEKSIKDMSFSELAEKFPVEEGLEERTDGSEIILVPYKEIRVAQYEMPIIPSIDFNNINLNTLIKPHRVEMRIRIYEGDTE